MPTERYRVRSKDTRNELQFFFVNKKGIIDIDETRVEKE
jgi:hypothetical protein